MINLKRKNSTSTFWILLSSYYLGLGAAVIIAQFRPTMTLGDIGVAAGLFIVFFYRVGSAFSAMFSTPMAKVDRSALMPY